MKKFAFSLETVLKIREVFKKQKEIEYSQACAELEKLFSIKCSLEEELEKCANEYSTAIKSPMTGSRIAWYYDYTGFLKENILSLEAPIRNAQRRKDALQEQLIALTREVDALEKLKKEQYHGYLSEAAKEEEKILGDLMSYESSVRNCGQEPA